MTDYTILSNTAVGVGGLPSGATVTALRDNPLAIAEGTAGAPRIWLPSFERLEAGTSIRSRNDTPLVLGAGQTTTLHQFSFIQHGTIRVSVRKTAGTGTVIVRRLRNGALTTLLSSTSTTTHTVDVAVIPGDSVEIAGSSPAVTGNLTFDNGRFQTNGQDLWPGVSVKLEGNRSAT